MAALQNVSLCVFAVLMFLATGESFFLYSTKKTSQDRGGMPPQYYRDSTPSGPIPWGPQQYTFDGSGPVTVALPVAVPIQAQMAPMPATLKGTVHNVQLVPCLCPVSKDVDPSTILQPQQHTASASYIVPANQPTANSQS